MKNHDYIFILGKNPSLSLAEIRAKFNSPHISILSKNVALLNLDKPIQNPQTILNQMGGTIKIAKYISTYSNESYTEDNIIDFITNNLKDYRHIGFSYYEFNKNLNKTLINIKKELRKDKISKRFIFENEKNELTAASIKKNKLTSKGTEIVIVNTREKQYFASTIAHQDVDKYSLRDYGKPKPDSRAGMLPPKLAQMMINLAQPPEKTTIYDPFCGSGTVLQEGLLLGHRIIGSDLSEKAIIQTRENIKWLVKKFDLELNNYRKYVEKNIFNADATYYELDNPVDTIVTEPYLGPAHRNIPSNEFAIQILKNLTPTYEKFLKTSSKNLKIGGKMVFVIPIIKTIDSKHSIDIKSLLDEDLSREYNIIQFDKTDLIYEQPNQKVLRKITVLEKIK